jgi:hypothetical protein
VRDAIGTQALEALLDPTTSVGFAPQIVARVTEARRSGWMEDGPG